MEKKSDTKDEFSDRSDGHHLVSLKLGVWRLVMLKTDSFDVATSIRDIFSAILPVLKMVLDIYALAPVLTTFYVVAQLSGLSSLLQTESAVTLYLSGRLLKTVETGISEGISNFETIATLVLMQVCWIIASTSLNWYQNEHVFHGLQQRVTAHYTLIRMKVQLHNQRFLDTEGGYRHHGDDTVWNSFHRLLSFFSMLTSMCANLALIVRTSREFGHPLFALVCILQPLYQNLSAVYIWGSDHFYHAENKDFIRMHAMSSLTDEQYRSEVLSGGLSDYIIAEHAKSSNRVDNLQTTTPDLLYSLSSTPLPSIFSDLIGRTPIICLALFAMINPSAFSVTSFAILQQYSANLQLTLRNLLSGVGQFRNECKNISSLCDSLKMPPALSEGSLGYPPYPRSELEKGPWQISRGMSFDVRDLCFSYPNGTSALTNVSFSIKSGQLVVIVGTNGSGKSTLIKLLTRMVELTSGTIFVDGNNMTDYKLSDFRRATASFMQDHEIFPLSFLENIRTGNVDSFGGNDEVIDAVRKGGAEKFLSDLLEGQDTVLGRITDCRVRRFSLYEDDNKRVTSLGAEWERLPQPVQTSGGEKQRIIAARTFMRFNSGKVTFAAVDEASSAIDAAGEVQLFDNLIKEREGKTLVIVTHRFGCLTRQADLILCMKDGTLCESGRHGELLALNGEYAKLYNIQAGAFTAVNVDGHLEE
ncbi:P-loop containing nucleoside triphosphate hydrolase protein [Armillaria novae-zelandiae]|uniref:P-loop containing nucleoside triphosphate hydrolase protein n=1 Tax=Armillaria novae-zelandiae TaxID=153914 RepID=A0AA39PEP0_9AGAR|nr:P-loop containing nucleoside triphosphate hydrolase protein [Armillaria novae-zelandiae]